MKFLLSVVWILIGAALTGGVYWSFLITPESTVWSLMVSAVLAFVALALAGLTTTAAIALSSFGASAGALRRALAAAPSVIPAALIIFAVWWITARMETWVALRNGQINAWFIARFGWDDVSWLFTIIHYGAQWLRWVIAALLAVSLLTGVVDGGWRGLAQASWLRRALHPRAAIVATVGFVLLVALPWIYLVPWRPKNLPATSIEFVFIIAKLSVAAILMAIGLGLFIRAVSSPAAAPAIPEAPASVAS